MNKVLLVEDNESLAKIIIRILDNEGIQVVHFTDLGGAIYFINTEDFDLLITDLRLPDGDGYKLFEKIKEDGKNIPVIVITAHGNISDAVGAVKKGVFDYITKPFDNEEFVITVKNALSFSSIKRENENLKDINRENTKIGIIGKSKSIKEMVEKIELVAPTDAPVLIMGESGVGKELVAKYIHQKSLRKDKTFVSLNCSAIPENLFESEFFGHKKGAFTGADNEKKGKLEVAHNGTIFLDEIGDVPYSVQPKLLRFLQEGEIEKVGDIRAMKISARVIAATNRDLKKMIEDGSFRLDLYYRLNIFPILVPPLRQRKDDIPALIDSFVKKFRKNLLINEEIMEYFYNYDWPGNVRELENLIYRLSIICKDGIVNKYHLPPEIYSSREIKSCIIGMLPDNELDLEELEKTIFEKTLEKFNGNKSKAAKYLKIPRHILVYRLGKFGIE